MNRPEHPTVRHPPILPAANLANRFLMDQPNSPSSGSSTMQLVLYWAIVGVPLAWGVYKTLLKLPALFQ